MHSKQFARCAMDKKDICIELLTIAMLVIAFLTNIQILILISFCAACFFVAISECQKSVCYLAFFTSFAGIFVYNGKHMFFVMAAIFILSFFARKKMNVGTICFYMLIAAYCLLFCDFDGAFSFAKVLSIILLFTIPVIASGGAGKMEHFRDAFIEGNADAALAASVFHFSEIPIPELKQYLCEQGINVRR